jgi:hypothetical protein
VFLNPEAVKEQQNEEWSKEDYIAWKTNRGADIAKWNMSDCRRGDAHIKNEAVKNFKEKVDSMDLPVEFKDWCKSLIRLHFGSCETDNMLTALGLYPDYM